MRIIGLDIHRVFAEAVALEDGEYRRLGRVSMMNRPGFVGDHQLK